MSVWPGNKSPVLVSGGWRLLPYSVIYNKREVTSHFSSVCRLLSTLSSLLTCILKSINPFVLLLKRLKFSQETEKPSVINRFLTKCHHFEKEQLYVFKR